MYVYILSVHVCFVWLISMTFSLTDLHF